MHHDQVRELEAAVEAALVDLFREQSRAGVRPVRVPSARTLHLMAKAAVTVLEATEPPEKP